MKEFEFTNIRRKITFEHQKFDIYCHSAHKISKAYRTNRIHTHDVFEILLCRSDNIFLLNNDVISLLQKNDLLLFNDTDVHGIITDPDMTFDRYVLMFEPGFVRELCSTYNLLDCFHRAPGKAVSICHLTEEQADNIISFYDTLKQYNKYDSDIIKLKKKIVLAEMLLEINILFSESSIKPRVELHSDPQYEKIQCILSFINNNLAGELSLEIISKQFYISISYLSALFKDVTGSSLNNYIITKRILLATDLLRQNRPVTAVTELCGFNNYSHFIRTFKKFEGVSPKQYAVRWRNKERLDMETPGQKRREVK
ncbi:MAG: AraC family transcriptional regulator [Treponema sp.]|jgi:AraC-like DNA-binding protein|nr:AraC family transcriptional regulator [Treponema sp.]